MGGRDKIIHAIEGTQHSAFTATGRADDGGDFLRFNLEIDMLLLLEIDRKKYPDFPFQLPIDCHKKIQSLIFTYLTAIFFE